MYSIVHSGVTCSLLRSSITSNLLSNTLSPYCCLLHPCKKACRIVILYFKYLYFPLAGGKTNKECKTKWQHAFGEVRVCAWRHQLVCWQTAVLQVTLYLGLCASCRAGYVGPHMRMCPALSRSVPAATLRNFGRWHSRMTLMADSGTGKVAIFVICWD